MLEIIITLITVCYFLANGIEFIMNPLPKLSSIQSFNLENQPLISIIVCARNEAKTIRKAMQTLLNIQYDNKEIILINDRSDDETASILLNEFAEKSKLRIIHNHELPDDWIGKNYAMQLGAKQARGEWLLFTDADIHFGQDTLSKSIAYVTQHQLDHLSIMPKCLCVSPLFGAVMCAVVSSLFFFSKPWRATDSLSKNSVGIGAFNLVKKSVYNAINGHESIRMNADDDAKLGQIIKHAGFNQELLDGVGELSVEWYSSVKTLIRGMEKNSFAVCNYNPAITWMVVISMAILYFAPFALAFSKTPWIAITNVLTILFTSGLCLLMSKRLEQPTWIGILYPIGILIYLYFVFMSMINVRRKGALDWRGTLYPLQSIKRYHLKTLWAYFILNL